VTPGEAFDQLNIALHRVADVGPGIVGPWSIDRRFDLPVAIRRGRDGDRLARVGAAPGGFAWLVSYRPTQHGERVTTGGITDTAAKAARVCDLLLITGGDVLVGSTPAGAWFDEVAGGGRG